MLHPPVLPQAHTEETDSAAGAATCPAVLPAEHDVATDPVAVLHIWIRAGKGTHTILAFLRPGTFEVAGSTVVFIIIEINTRTHIAGSIALRAVVETVTLVTDFCHVVTVMVT